MKTRLLLAPGSQQQDHLWRHTTQIQGVFLDQVSKPPCAHSTAPCHIRCGQVPGSSMLCCPLLPERWGQQATPGQQSGIRSRSRSTLHLRVVQGCPCSPALVLQGKWAEGEPKHPDGRGIFNRTGTTPDFVHRPGGFHSPYIGWWYMIHGGEWCHVSAPTTCRHGTDS